MLKTRPNVVSDTRSKIFPSCKVRPGRRPRCPINRAAITTISLDHASNLLVATEMEQSDEKQTGLKKFTACTISTHPPTHVSFPHVQEKHCTENLRHCY